MRSACCDCDRYSYLNIVKQSPEQNTQGYETREEAQADIFDYIEIFNNPIRRHGYNSGLSPVQLENQFSVRQIHT